MGHQFSISEYLILSLMLTSGLSTLSKSPEQRDELPSEDPLGLNSFSFLYPESLNTLGGKRCGGWVLKTNSLSSLDHFCF